MDSTRSITSPCVEVYFWLAVNSKGVHTTSNSGAASRKKAEKISQEDIERCGHVSMSLFPNDEESHYVSFWPNNPDGASLVESLSDDIEEEDNCNPDVIIRLHKLDVPEMIKAFNIIKERVYRGELKWNMTATSYADITLDENKVANCATAALTILNKGGFKVSSSVYFEPSRRGPRDSSFYHITKCHAGDLYLGIFNGIFWMEWFFTPKTLLLTVASAAERNPIDKSKTIEIMQSNNVNNLPEERLRLFKQLFKTVVCIGIAYKPLQWYASK